MPQSFANSGCGRPAVVIVLISALLLVGCSGGDVSVAERIERAQQHLEDGQLRAARIELKNALQTAPDNGDARLMLGRVSVRMGAGAAAEKELRRAAELGKPPADTAYWMARALQQQGEYARLLNEVQLDPTWANAERGRVAALRSQAHAATGAVEDARAALNHAREFDPEGLETRLAAVSLALANDSRLSASSLAAEATESYPSSERAWRLRAQAALAADRVAEGEGYLGRAIELAHTPFAERVLRARLRLTQGNIEGAREDVTWLGERASDHPAFLFTDGLVTWAEGDQEAACTRFNEALSKAPELRGAHFYVGVCHYRAGKYNQAEAYLRQAYQGRAMPTVARVLGATYLAQQRYDRAREVVRPILQSQPEDRGALALMARIEEGAGNSSEAIEYLRRLARLEPGNPLVRLQLGAGLLRSGEVAAARSALSDALSLDPEFEQASALLVMSYIERNEYEAALDTARELARERPDAPLPHSLQGEVHLAQGNREAARSAFETALEHDPGDPGARHALARMALEDGEIDAARKHYQTVLDTHGDHVGTLAALAALAGRDGNPDRAESLLERAHQADRGALAPRLLLARLRLSAGQPRHALEVLTDGNGEVPENADALVLASRARIAAGQYEQVEPDLQRLLELRPESTVPYVLLAQLYSATGRSEEANRQMSRILDRDPDHPLALLVQARAHLSRGETQPAGQLLERVPEAHREHPAYLDARGRLALREGRRDDALGYYRKAHEVAPSSETVRRLASLRNARGGTDQAVELMTRWLEDHVGDVQARMLLGDLYAGAGRKDAAAEAYRAVLDRNPGSAAALNNLAWVLRDTAPAEALRYAEQAIEISPGDPRVLDTLGMVLLDNGESERAVQRLQEAVSAAPDAPVVRYHLAQALVQAGQRNAAVSELETALSGEAAFADAEKARALLDDLRSGG